MTIVQSLDPRTWEVVEDVAPSTPPGDVARVCSSAAAAAKGLEALGRTGRSGMLRAMADALEDDRGGLVMASPDGRYRFVDPLHHTYAQVALLRRRATPEKLILNFDFAISEMTNVLLDLGKAWPGVVVDRMSYRTTPITPTRRHPRTRRRRTGS